ncbi:geranylgeranyl reductase family protein [Sporolactobacillus sp. THM19-2]|jgi:geranylgeranyl reductase family protein|uniref:geranylgeranyl reductase family protein n=1 Tax=Sporolactobacillus sp. THM19-2 TaxID=2511171 RepID=UPI00102140C5|nr:geranylgeranyl reductase family protein [Sporolactobacillus sp. THM19-2]RYL87511.1 geranylgeranyl reductase family protein [Sporolactobacillus sp. THM19-2]
MDSKVYDVIIVGAGPGGSSLAAKLAEAGLHVLILEKQSFPRYKVCGGGVTKRAFLKMPIDITPIIRDQITSFVTVEGNHDIQEFKHKTPFIYMVMRDELDQLLAKHAVDCGAELKEDSFVKKVVEYGGGVEVFTRDEKYSGRYLVGADGVNSIVAKQVGLMLERRKALALEYEFRCNQTTNTKYKNKVIIDYTSVPDGYIWIFPKNGILSAGIGSYSLGQKLMSKYLHSFLNHQEVSGDLLSAKGSFLSAGGTRQTIMAQRTALIGDAAGLVDSFAGEGIYYALWSAELLADHLIKTIRDGYNEAFSTYQRDVDLTIMPELSTLDQFGREFYKNPKLMQKIVSRFPKLLSLVFDVLEGKRDYSKLYKKFNIVKSYGHFLNLKSSIFT